MNLFLLPVRGQATIMTSANDAQLRRYHRTRLLGVQILLCKKSQEVFGINAA